MPQPDGNVIRLMVEGSGLNPKSKGCFFGLDTAVLKNQEETKK